MFFLGDSPLKQAAQVWTRLPDEFRATACRTAWADANKGGQIIDSFLEGPVFDEKGNLFVTDIPYGRVFRISPSKEWSLVAQYDGEPNGMKWLAQGMLLITDYQNGLMQLEVATGKVTPFLARRNAERFKGVNDLTFDRAGNLYFTDQGQTGLHDPSGRVYRLSKSGELRVLLDNVPSPNGVVLSPDERVMFVGVTRANEVWRAPIMADGSVSKVGRFFSSHGPSGPDGLAMDEAGHLIIANPGLGCAWRLNHLGEPTHVWTSPTGQTLTNIAFGGSDNKQLFMTESESGSILMVQAPAPGAAVQLGE